MYQFAAVQQTSTVKLQAFYLRFQTAQRVLRVNKSETTGQNTFHEDLFEIEDNHESSKEEENLFLDIFVDLLGVL